jgi:hypothetical protein
VTRASAGQIERARRLLVHEGATGGSSEACAAAAGRVYEKLDAQFATLLGRAGVRALFARSAKLAQTELPSLADALDDSAKLSAHLQSLDAAVAGETAAVLFATFLDLIISLIGDRLTVQVLRSAWPAIDEMSPRETHK